MKISVIMCTRGRPMQATAAFYSLESQESKKHEVTYGFCVDADDIATIGTCQTLQARHANVAYHSAERGPSLGARVNMMTEYMPADVYVTVCDDTLCFTQDWDERIAKAYTKNPQGVWWWQNYHPEPALYAIVSEAWRKAAGKIYTDYFPYWFDDIWLLELWIMASEQPHVYIDAKLGDYPRATLRMRDLPFWHEFWHYMRPARVKEAKRIAAELGWKEPVCAEVLATVFGRPVPEFVSNMEKIEANQGDLGPATIEYIKAKSRAQEMMNQPQDIVRIRKEVAEKIAPLLADYERAMSGQT